MKSPPIFDGHNDVLYNLFSGEVELGAFGAGGGKHIDVVKARAGGLVGGMFAIFVPDGYSADDDDEMLSEIYDLALPPKLEWQQAAQAAIAQASFLTRLEEAGSLRICRDISDIDTAIHSGTLAAVMHMEGADAIDPDLHMLDVLHAAGLRSLGIVWSRPTIFGEGVPFKFPSTGDTGPGLTENGIRLVKRCNQLGIMLDLSHLTEAGFWDVARHSSKPLVATHSNAHALCTHSRNLTDRQLHAIRDSDGMVGLNFCVAFLRKDGQMNGDTPIERMVDHLDYLIEQVGEDRVGLGSDFDATVVPAAIGDASGLQNLRDAMQRRGYSDVLLEKICYRNWLRVLELSWS